MAIGTPAWMIDPASTAFLRHYVPFTGGVMLRDDHTKLDVWLAIAEEIHVHENDDVDLSGRFFFVCKECLAAIPILGEDVACKVCLTAYDKVEAIESAKLAFEAAYFGVIYRRWFESTSGVDATLSADEAQAIDYSTRSTLPVRAFLFMPSDLLVWIAGAVTGGMLGNAVYDLTMTLAKKLIDRAPRDLVDKATFFEPDLVSPSEVASATILVQQYLEVYIHIHESLASNTKDFPSDDIDDRAL